MRRRIAITGLGAVTPIGIGIADFWEASTNGKSGAGEITLFDASQYENRLAAEVKGFNPSDFMLPEVYRKTDRFAQMGVAAAKMAIEDSGILSVIDPQKNRVPVIIGSGLGGSMFHEEQIFQLIEGKEPRRVLSSSVPRIAPNAVSAYIAMQFKLHGPNMTISTACSSGGNAIATAAELIRNGIADIAITGGVECPITPFTYAAYMSLRVLAKEENGIKQPRPFDKNRNGFMLGEGAGILVLENYKKAEERKAKIYAELLGYASNCGAYHMAAPDPSGEDAAEAIQSALEFSRIKPSDIDYINAHGTATKINDIAETKAIQKIFENKMPYVCSTKSQTGHTIGAAGAIEAILTVLSLEDQIIPPTINCDEIDEECKVNIVRYKALECKINYAISNSFGFGSNNSVLVFKK